MEQELTRQGGCSFCSRSYCVMCLPAGKESLICTLCLRDQHPNKSLDEFIEWWERQAGWSVYERDIEKLYDYEQIRNTNQ